MVDREGQRGGGGSELVGVREVECNLAEDTWAHATERRIATRARKAVTKLDQ